MPAKPLHLKVLIVSAVALAYFLSARLGLSLATQPQQVTAIWPAAGVAVAALLVFGVWAWPGVAVGAFFANLLAAEPVGTALSISIGNTLESVVAVVLLRWSGDFNPAFSRIRDVARLAMLGSLCSAIVAATIGVFSLWISGLISKSAVPDVWMLWWLGDALGIFIVTPFLLTWSAPEPLAQPRLLERIVFLPAIAGATAVIMVSNYAIAPQLTFLLFPMMAWSAYRLGLRTTTTAALVVSVIAIFGVLHNSHTFASDNLNERLLLFQGFVGVLSLTGLCLSAAVAERRAAQAALEEGRQQLEQRISEKTGDLQREIEARRRSEAELAASGMVLQSFIDNLSTFTAKLDTEGRMLLVGRAAQLASGFSYDVLKTMNFLEGPWFSFDPAVKARVAAAFERAKAGTPVNYDERIMVFGDKELFINFSLVPVLAGGKVDYILAEGRDISAQKSAEESLRVAEADLRAAYGQLEERVRQRTAELAHATDELRQSEQRLQAIIDNSNAIVYVKDPTGKYLLVNREWEAVNGMKRAEIIGRSTHDAFPKEAADVLVANDCRVAESGIPLQFEEQVPHRGGVQTYISNKFPLLNERGEVYAVCGVSTNISARKEVERRIEDSEARKTAILESALDCIITIDHLGNVLEWNPAAEKTFGYSKAEAIGREMAELLIPPAFREQHRKGLARCVTTGEAPLLNQRLELSAIRKDGTEFPTELAITKVSRTNPPVFTGYLRDITERKRIEKREKQAKADAEAANRAKDEFLAVVSHELRTPLTPILGWSRMLRSGVLSPDQVQRALEVIDRNVRTQGQLIEDLLDISRIITGKLRIERLQLNLSDVLAAAIETVRPAAEAKKIQIRILAIPPHATMQGDPNRLQQVIWNLLTNAIKFSLEGGQIDVAIEETTAWIELRVQDYGRGISSEFLPQMFNRFSQADTTPTRRHGGLGLGLAIVKHIVELHGGSVAAYSKGEGEGATFRVRLPISGVTPQHGDVGPHYVTPVDGSPAVPCLKGLRILVIDDEKDSREFVSTALEQWGAQITMAASAVEGLDAAQKLRPDVIVCDIGMPVEDGYSFIRRLRQLPPELGSDAPVIALTAFARAEDRTRILAAGFCMHVPKPVDPFELAKSVSAAAAAASRP